jgi:arsenite methyltransferase
MIYIILYQERIERMKKILITMVMANMAVSLNAGCPSKGCCAPSAPSNPVNTIATQAASTKREPKELIQEAYGKAVQAEGFVCQTGGCCGGGSDLSKGMGYTDEELAMFADANLGLGCGHPVSLGYIKSGDTVLDLGSGAGMDCFLAARIVGSHGAVIGVDMTQAMIDKARMNAQKYKFSNVEFRLGDIENLPVASGSVDVIISNCVINLATDKRKVFQEAYRVLRAGGKMVISDVVLLGNLTKAQKNDPRLLCACVSGALLKQDYLSIIQNAGFSINVIDEDKDINTKWFDSSELPIASLKFVAYKK